MENAMTRRDLLKAGAFMGMAAVGAGMVGCATQTNTAAAAEPFNDTSKAAAGVHPLPSPRRRATTFSTFR